MDGAIRRNARKAYGLWAENPFHLVNKCGRGDADESSHIDFLVEMEPNRNLLDLGALLTDLRELMGRRVDVVSEKGLYWLLRRRILKEAKLL
jgi:hypothetical protein